MSDRKMSTNKMLDLVHPELTTCPAVSRSGDPCMLQIGHAIIGRTLEDKRHCSLDDNGDTYDWRERG